MTLAELTAFGPVSRGWAALPPDQADGPRPVIVQCHERYGVVRHTVGPAERFATGSATVAPDFHADMGLTGEEERLPDVPDDDVPRHLDAAIGRARTLPGVRPDSPVGVVGVCRSGSPPDPRSAERDVTPAAVMLYGGAQGREYRTGAARRRPYAEMIAAAPVLGLWGKRDHTMSVEQLIRRVRGLLEDGRRNYDFRVSADLPPGWLKDTTPGRFRAQARQSSPGGGG